MEVSMKWAPGIPPVPVLSYIEAVMWTLPESHTEHNERHVLYHGLALTGISRNTFQIEPEQGGIDRHELFLSNTLRLQYMPSTQLLIHT